MRARSTAQHVAAQEEHSLQTQLVKQGTGTLSNRVKVGYAIAGSSNNLASKDHHPPFQISRTSPFSH
jgi:hypothetical protein